MKPNRTHSTTSRSRLSLLLLSLILTACATTNPNRPPCTWELWAVDGALVNADDGRRLPCQGPLHAECVGMTKIDFFNLLYCGGKPALKPAPAPIPPRGPQP